MFSSMPAGSPDSSLTFEDRVKDEAEERWMSDSIVAAGGASHWGRDSTKGGFKGGAASCVAPISAMGAGLTQV